VEKRWRAACNANNDSDQFFSSLPTNSDLTDAFLDRKHRLFYFLLSPRISLYTLQFLISISLLSGQRGKRLNNSDKSRCNYHVNFHSPFFRVTLLLLFREGSARGFGIRKSNSTLGSDSWVDDPITRHVVGLYINKEEEDIKNLLWPLILHTKGLYSILILPMVEPRHLKAYARLCKRSDCGTALGMDDGLSSLLLDLPSVTGYVKLVANTTNVPD